MGGEKKMGFGLYSLCSACCKGSRKLLWSSSRGTSSLFADPRQWKRARPDFSVCDQSCNISAPEYPRGPACDFRAVPRRQFPVAYCHSILDNCGQECELVMSSASNVQCSQQRPQTHHFANLVRASACSYTFSEQRHLPHAPSHHISEEF